MQFEDADEDEPLVAGDVLATPQDLEAAAKSASADAVLRRRLLKASAYILGMTAVLKRRCQPEDLLQEALMAVLTGRRAWKKNRVDFAGLLVGVMRSLASSHDASLQTKDAHVLVESDLPATSEVGDEVGIVDRFGDGDSSPEALALDAEHDAEIASAFTIIRAKFGHEDLAGRIVDMMAQRRGYMPADIRKALNVSDREFWSAYRRVTRALGDFQEKGAEQ